MRNTLITIAAWSAAITLVLWQRAIWPGLKTFLPGIEDLAADIRSGLQPPAPAKSPQPVVPAQETEPQPIAAVLPIAEPAAVETYIIERKVPTPKRAARPAPKRAAQPVGFAS